MRRRQRRPRKTKGQPGGGVWGWGGAEGGDGGGKAVKSHASIIKPRPQHFGHAPMVLAPPTQPWPHPIGCERI